MKAVEGCSRAATGPSPGWPASGTQSAASSWACRHPAATPRPQLIDIMRFDADGKIAEHWGVMDMLTMMQQLVPSRRPACTSGKSAGH